MKIPDIDDLYNAYNVLGKIVYRTPLMFSDHLNTLLQAKVLIKPELLQKTGSFKFRGAYNRVSRVDRDRFPGGVVACSSGNHAQGVAEAARLCGIHAVIVMPKDAPKMKVERTQRSGAQVIFYDRNTEDRQEIALSLCEQRKADFVAPYDDPYVISGQGTAGLELVEQFLESNHSIDLALSPCSGGGLLAGWGIAIKNTFPDAKLYCVEPEGFDDHRLSLESGEITANSKTSGSICDALLAREPGELTFLINQKQLNGGVVVSDQEVCEAVKFAYKELKLIVEPGGACALAALLSNKLEVKGKTVAIVLTGGNVDPTQFAKIIEN